MEAVSRKNRGGDEIREGVGGGWREVTGTNRAPTAVQREPLVAQRTGDGITLVRTTGRRDAREHQQRHHRREGEANKTIGRAQHRFFQGGTVGAAGRQAILHPTPPGRDEDV